MKSKRDLHRLVDELPESELEIAARYLEYLRNLADPVLRVLLEAPVDDETITHDMAQALDEAKQQALHREGRPREEVRRT